MSRPAVTEETPAVSSEPNFLPTDKNYRLTGEMPADTESASAAFSEVAEKEDKETPPEKDAASAAASDTAAASEAADTQREREDQQHRKTAATSESRWAKISRENRELREKLARAEGRQEARTETQTAQQRDAQQTSQPAADAKTGAKPKIDDVDPKTGKAKYASYGEYEDAKDQWLSDEAVRKFQETSAKTEQQRAREQSERAIGEKMVKKFEGTRAKYADFDQVALNPDLIIPMGSVTDAFLLDSDHAGEVAYHLGQHPEILQGFYGDHDLKTGRFTNKVTPQRQFRALMDIEAKFAGAVVDKTSSSAKPISQAARPPHQVSGTGTVGKDAVEQALEDGDFESYQKAQNAKELARLKRK
jgi:hypothetical protein